LTTLFSEKENVNINENETYIAKIKDAMLTLNPIEKYEKFIKLKNYILTIYANNSDPLKI